MEKDTSSILENLKQKFPDYASVLDSYQKHKQDHIFNFANAFENDDQTKAFLETAKQFDLDLVDELYDTLWVKKSNQIQSSEQEKEKVDIIKNSLRMKDMSKE